MLEKSQVVPSCSISFYISPHMFHQIFHTPSPQQKKINHAVVFFCFKTKNKRNHQAEVVEFVDFLKSPGKYEKLGARVPKGAWKQPAIRWCVRGLSWDTLKGMLFFLMVKLGG